MDTFELDFPKDWHDRMKQVELDIEKELWYNICSPYNVINSFIVQHPYNEVAVRMMRSTALGKTIKQYPLTDDECFQLSDRYFIGSDPAVVKGKTSLVGIVIIDKDGNRVFHANKNKKDGTMGN